eukprot:16077713-Heterocapsa_arctica.AAC.1
MLKNAESMAMANMPGWEEKTEVQWKDKEKRYLQKAMLYHQQKADYNTREYLGDQESIHGAGGYWVESGCIRRGCGRWGF